MAKFRKKPVVIEAVRYEGGPSVGNVLFWMGAHHSSAVSERKGVYREGRFFIRTLEGEMEAMPGDWIIRGVKGEFYPCKPDIFAATYEDANADPYVTTTVDQAVAEAKRFLEAQGYSISPQ